MVSIDQVEKGIAKYMDEELLPTLPQQGWKGFGLSVAAGLLIKRGGAMLREAVKAPVLQKMGLVSPEGAVDLAALREVMTERMPETGLVIETPLGINLRMRTEDMNNLFKAIEEVKV